MTLGSRVFNKVLSTVGSVYGIRIGSEAINSRGDTTVTWSAFTGLGYVFVANADNEAVKAGIANIGDSIGYFREDAPIVVGSRTQINHQSLWWEAFAEPIVHHFSGNNLVREVVLKKPPQV